MSELSTKQRKRLDALLKCDTYQSACALLTISRVTLWRWMKDPVFSQAYVEWRQHVQREATALAQKSLVTVVQTWRAVLQNPIAPPMARIRAGSEIATFALKSIEQEDLARKLNDFQQHIERFAYGSPAPAAQASASSLSNSPGAPVEPSDA